MKAPICERCIKSGILCEECEQKVSSKEISELDIRIARTLQKLEDRDLLRGATFERAYEVDNLIIITTKGKVGALVGRGGRVVRLLSKEFNRKVRIINTTSTKSTLQDLVAPARIHGINIIYKPDGEQTKAIISREDKYKLIAPSVTLEKAANLISDKTIVLEVR